MELPEPPECPVCLGEYDTTSTVPRVLSCGHSICEACIFQLPNPFASTIRCPSCTQLVKLPSCPSFLPKNIDLLRLSSSLQSHNKGVQKLTQQSPHQSVEKMGSEIPFISNFWSLDFYLKWKNWVIPKDSIIAEIDCKSDESFPLYPGKFLGSSEHIYSRCTLRENEKVYLLKIGNFKNESEKLAEKDGYMCNNSSKFKYSYKSKILKVLDSMKTEINEVSLVLEVSSRIDRVGRIYGFWCNEEDDSVYMAIQGFNGSLNNLWDLKNGLLGNIEAPGMVLSQMVGFGLLAVEACEVVNDLHVDQVVVGCMGLSCLSFNKFGHVFINIGEVFRVSRRVCSAINIIEDTDIKLLEAMELQNSVFVSPEVLLELLMRKGFELGDGSLKYEVGYASDTWSLACILILLIVGKSLADEFRSYYCFHFTAMVDQKSFDYLYFYSGWMERIVALLEVRLGSEFFSLKEFLRCCLSFNPENRPLVTDLRKCIRELFVKSEFDLITHSEIDLPKQNSFYCLILGNLCQISTKTGKGKTRKTSDVVKDKNGGKDDQIDGSRSHHNAIEGLCSDYVKCIELKGHLDSITGLAVGGDFLFSASHDKIINVWSLQDFSHVHSFKGHRDRVTAVVFVDGEEPLCASADKGGVICFWGARHPLDLTPRKTLFEPKDWRYSGIHALATSGTQYLYTGSGDRSIKAWSLQDYTLTCTMTGHKSVVSSLVVSNSVLYSGSWDGTVRLWSLDDHNPLAILGEDNLGTLSSVLFLAVDDNMLVVAHENGTIKIWYDDVLLNSREVHNGAVISMCKEGKWLFTGGWDSTINIQMLPGDRDLTEAILMGSISSDSVITSLIYWQGKLFVGQANRVIKVYDFVE